MSETLVKVENVSKKFCRNLKRSLWYGMKDLGYELLGRSPHRAKQLRESEFWAVKDVGFELKRGERLGLIGRNGAGKTTLLRMLNGLIKPDNGRIEMRGRVSALIALGAGFNPILTGRENIYINGAVLGLTKKEIDEKYQEIVDFAEIGEFIDSPVQTYSSGMHVRLGFSVAASLEPDVLILDEVLAVGDARFRSKCMDRMWSIAENKRVVIIFVSHDMLAVDGFCDRIIYLEKGAPSEGSKGELMARYFGEDVSYRYKKINPAVRQHLLSQKMEVLNNQTGDIEIRSVKITDEKGEEKEYFRPSDELKIKIVFESKLPLDKVISSFSIKDPNGLVVSIERSIYNGLPAFSAQGENVLEIHISPIQLKAGVYYIGFAFQDPTLRSIYCLRRSETIKVIEDMPNMGGKEGFFHPNIAWKKL